MTVFSGCKVFLPWKQDKINTFLRLFAFYFFKDFFWIDFLLNQRNWGLEDAFISRIYLALKYTKKTLLKRSRFVRNKQLTKLPNGSGYIVALGFPSLLQPCAPSHSVLYPQGMKHALPSVWRWPCAHGPNPESVKMRHLPQSQLQQYGNRTDKAKEKIYREGRVWQTGKWGQRGSWASSIARREEQAGPGRLLRAGCR